MEFSSQEPMTCSQTSHPLCNEGLLCCGSTKGCRCVCVNTIEDYRREAKKNLEESLEKYISGGAGAQPDDNARAFNHYIIRPYLIHDTSRINLSTTILGNHVNFPLCICPMGMQHQIDVKAEHVTATAARTKGVGFTMSAWASTTMEDLIAESNTGLKFLNVYIYKNRDWTKELVSRAEKAGFRGLVFGFAKVNPASKRVSKGIRLSYANLKHLTQATDPSEPDYPLPDVSVSWSDVTWLKSITKLPIIIKGVLSARDAVQAAAAGADAILVSNHGGRQLYPVPAPIDVLPEIVASVGHRCEVYLDGGVRSGADMFTALALGARAVFVGRPILWGMACGGLHGVQNVLDIYQRELQYTMNMAGVSSVQEIPKDIIFHKDKLISKL